MSNFPLESTRQAILDGDHRTLAKAITLLENTRQDLKKSGQQLLESLLPHTGSSTRIAITGVPGVGKSTFIEALGLHVIDKGHQVAVLTVDPSSPVSGGSILGDKTRMHDLSQHPKAFIRPSPTSGVLGGVAQQTHETILLCEAAGFDVVLVETVGVGQSEIQVVSMVDLLVLMLLPNAGDELQAIKKGILEMADLILVNKTDGHFRKDAERTQQQISSALSFNRETDGPGLPEVLTCSALKREGQGGAFESLLLRKYRLEQSGLWVQKRNEQLKKWLNQLIRDELYFHFLKQPGMDKKITEIASDVQNGKRLPTQGASTLVESWLYGKR